MPALRASDQTERDGGGSVLLRGLARRRLPGGGTQGSLPGAPMLTCTLSARMVPPCHPPPTRAATLREGDREAAPAMGPRHASPPGDRGREGWPRGGLARGRVEGSGGELQSSRAKGPETGPQKSAEAHLCPQSHNQTRHPISYTRHLCPPTRMLGGVGRDPESG